MSEAIVCGVDATSEARIAVRVAAGLAGALGLRLVVSHVVALPTPEPRALGAHVHVRLPGEREMQAGEEFLGTLLAEERLADAKQRVARGDPAERLADLADEERAAFLVVGSRGRGPFRMAFLGSVSNALIGLARCPVLVVPPGVPAPQAALRSEA